MGKLIDNWYWVFDVPKRNVVTAVDDFLTDEEINRLIEWGQDNLSPSTMGNGRLNFDLKIADSARLNVEGFEDIYNKLEKIVQLINSKHYNYLISKFEKLELLRYNKGGHMATHIDSPFNSSVKLSCIIPLTNQGIDYEGGDFILYDGNRPITANNGRHKLDMKKGSLVFYPGYMLHEVTPITSGTRMMLGTWVYGERPYM
jgi:predicted 2-oxoglutarate/Fe(II)-dependent dioxygenase YbiX